MERPVDLKELEKSNAFSLLIFLYENGSCKKTAIYSVANSALLPQKIRLLIEMGLVKEDQRRFEDNTKIVELTESGYAVASKIAEAVDLMRSSSEEKNGD